MFSKALRSRIFASPACINSPRLPRHSTATFSESMANVAGCGFAFLSDVLLLGIQMWLFFIFRFSLRRLLLFVADRGIWLRSPMQESTLGFIGNHSCEQIETGEILEDDKETKTPTLVSAGLIEKAGEGHNNSAVSKREDHIWKQHFVSCALCIKSFSRHRTADDASFCEECKCHVCSNCYCRIYHLDYQEEHWAHHDDALKIKQPSSTLDLFLLILRHSTKSATMSMNFF